MSGPLPDPSTAHLRRLVAGRSLADREGVPIESADLDEAAAGGLGVDAVTDRVEATLQDISDRMPPDEVGDPRDFHRALGILLRETRRAAGKLDADPTAPLSTCTP